MKKIREKSRKGDLENIMLKTSKNHKKKSIGDSLFSILPVYIGGMLLGLSAQFVNTKEYMPIAGATLYASLGTLYYVYKYNKNN